VPFRNVSYEEMDVPVRGGVLRKRRKFNTVGELNEFMEKDGGKLTMTRTGPQPTTITFTNFGKARHVLVSREVCDGQSGERFKT